MNLGVLESSFHNSAGIMTESRASNSLNKALPITTLFLDIGGVLLSNGWEESSRRLAATTFKLDFEEINERHHLTYDIYEAGSLSLEEYLDRVIFTKKRAFTQDEFWRFMITQSKPYPEMIALIRKLKARHHLKIAVVSNEARELNAYRIREFKLDEFVNFFISSCFVHIRKPDPEIFRMALDIANTPARQAVLIENPPMFVQVAEGFGIHGILHVDYESTRAKLAAMGFECADFSRVSSCMIDRYSIAPSYRSLAKEVLAEFPERTEPSRS